MSADKRSERPDPSDAFTSPIADPARPHALIQRFTLRVMEGPDRGATFVSRGARTVIGTHETTDFILGDATISRFHCEIVLEGAEAVVRDLGSRNGTRVEDVVVREAFLKDRAVLGIGQSRVRFEREREPVAVPVSAAERFGRLVGRSEAMRSVFAVLERAAATDVTVLLEGETGTGKDLAAESIHREGTRADRPFVVVDCGSVPPTLLESELFGHERGAFTGATEARPGAFEAADGGTLFLDEIGELGPDLQPKFLRAIENRKITRLGSTKVTPFDVRIIAATNRNLRSEVNAGRFRSDLYYRLAVLTVRLPPLRDRLDDVPLLVGEIVARLREGAYAHVDSDLARVLERLPAATDWPGNVRQLRNAVERGLVLDEAVPADEGSASDGAPAINAKLPLRVARARWLQHFERRYLEALLAANDHNVAASARAAGIDRVYLHRLLSRAGLR